MLTVPHCKESLSRAYVTAVVGRSRNNLLWGREFDYGVDGSVRLLEQRGSRIREVGLGFDFQSKSTTNWSIQGDWVVYDLEVDAYNDLTERVKLNATPFLLILLCLPKDDSAWLHVTSEQLLLKHCAYWAKLDGTLSGNASTCRIRIPTGNVFTPEAVVGILAAIKSGGLLP
jgi:hypothetical protein